MQYYCNYDRRMISSYDHHNNALVKTYDYGEPMTLINVTFFADSPSQVNYL